MGWIEGQWRRLHGAVEGGTRVMVVLSGALVLSLVMVAQAQAFVYWTAAGPIGRANLDGTGINRSFLTAGASYGVAVDARHIYSTSFTGQIERANLDGSGLNANFIVGANNPHGVAVDQGYIYWANYSGGTIGRANLDGTDANQNFITGAGHPWGVAVDATHVYWGNNDGGIGRANLDGTGINQRFIGTIFTNGVAVDASHIYWNGWSENLNRCCTIGRANLDGTGANPSLIFQDSNMSPVTYTGVAVDASYIYWADVAGRAIGRANLDGTGINQRFIDQVTPKGVAVDALIPPRATSSSVSCSPSPVTVGSASMCTASVVDTAGGTLSSPGGGVSFASNSTDGAFSSGGACSLGGGVAGSASCAVTWTPANASNTAPRTDTITATYAPSDNVHSGSASSGTGNGSVGVTLPDTTPPTSKTVLSPLSPNGQNGWYVSNVHAMVSATDPDDTVTQTRCVLDPGGPPASFDAIPSGCAYSGTGGDITAGGQHTIYAASVDSNGNKETPVSVSFKIDQTPPIISCGSADGLWHANNLSIACTASDGGSGLANPADASFSLATSVAAGSETANASTNSHQVCDAAGNCVTAGPIAGNKIDRRAPSVNCGAPDGLWHANNVSIACTASDGGSGLANPADASFSLATSVAAGSETANASTNSHQVCDAAGNCVTAGPIAGNKIDRKAPTITLTTPANGAHYSVLLTPPVHANYNCTDGGSGVASCVGTQPNGSQINTGLFALGTHTFTVTAKDNAGNTSTVTHTYSVSLL